MKQKKAFRKINNPKDLSLIRVFIKERLTEVGYTTTHGKRINQYKNIDLEKAYISVFKSNPVVDYLEYKKKLKSQGRKESIYFIGNREYELVKIGFSAYPEDKMKKLQEGCPFNLEFFGTVKGTVGSEKELCKKYGGLRVNAEWFRIGGGLKEYLEEL